MGISRLVSAYYYNDSRKYGASWNGSLLPANGRSTCAGTVRKYPTRCPGTEQVPSNGFSIVLNCYFHVVPPEQSRQVLKCRYRRYTAPVIGSCPLFICFEWRTIAVVFTVAVSGRLTALCSITVHAVFIHRSLVRLFGSRTAYLECTAILTKPFFTAIVTNMYIIIINTSRIK